VAEAVLNKIFSGNQPHQMNKKNRLLRTISVFMIMMMKTETVLETSVSFIRLTRLIAREDFIESCRRESFRSYRSCIICCSQS
jgi:hypothetical protein